MQYYFWLGAAAEDYHLLDDIDAVLSEPRHEDPTACPCGCGALDGAH